MKPLILAVDDCEDARLLITSILEMLDYQCITASEGETALQLARQHQPDLILLDICMPEMDGFEVMRRFKQDVKTMSIPVVVVTGVDIEFFHEWSLTLGNQAYLTKPYMIEDVDRVIRYHLSQPFNHQLYSAFLEINSGLKNSREYRSRNSLTTD